MAVIKAAKGGASLGKAMDYVERKAEITSGANRIIRHRLTCLFACLIGRTTKGGCA